MPQTHFGKAFRITASILKTRTVGSVPAERAGQGEVGGCTQRVHIAMLFSHHSDRWLDPFIIPISCQ